MTAPSALAPALEDFPAEVQEEVEDAAALLRQCVEGVQEAERQLWGTFDALGLDDVFREAAGTDPHALPRYLYDRLPVEVQQRMLELRRARIFLANQEESWRTFGGYLTGPCVTSPAEVQAVLHRLAAEERRGRRRGVLWVQLARPLVPVARLTSDCPWEGLFAGLYATGSILPMDQDPDLVVVRNGSNEPVSRTWCAPAGFSPVEAEAYRTFRRDGVPPGDAALFARVV